jgi:hypothetical protein
MQIVVGDLYARLNLVNFAATAAKLADATLTADVGCRINNAGSLAVP